jgi:hypothetical protein
MDGTLQAFVEARDQGLVRFLGVTGHGVKGPDMHLRSLDRFSFDAVMLTYNYSMMQNPRYASSFEKLVSRCREGEVALQTIKAIARQPWAGHPKTHHTYFYEPLVEQEAVDKAVHWALGLQGSFLVTAGDLQLLPKILEAATRYEVPPASAEMDAIQEQYKIQPIFS